MIGKLIPREEKFFDHFNEAAKLMTLGAQVFCRMIEDLEHAEKYAEELREIESNADKVTHHIIELLHKTFITPLDREEIHQLITKMDDVIDFIEATSDRIFLFNMKTIPKHGHQLADICLKSAVAIESIVGKLENMKDSGHIIKTCVEINRLENEADQVLRNALATLFREENDAKEIIKLKEIYELLETVTDRCEDVANIIEGIVLEHS
jgi:predicted phosphate transport protein (TIGR00153 family)